MDDRPIDPFTPEGRRHLPPAPPPWPPQRVEDDTREVPVVVPDDPPSASETTPRIRKPPPAMVAVGLGVVALALIVAATVFVTQPGDATGAPNTIADNSDTPLKTGGSASPSHSPTSAPEATEAPPSSPAAEEPEPDRQVTVPSRPTKFGAWFAGSGTYEAKWEAPADDGGADILSYVVGDCQGNNLAAVDSNTFEVTVYQDHLECMSVYAVNSAGLGAEAQHHITNNP